MHFCDSLCTKTNKCVSIDFFIHALRYLKILFLMESVSKSMRSAWLIFLVIIFSCIFLTVLNFSTLFVSYKQFIGNVEGCDNDAPQTGVFKNGWITLWVIALYGVITQSIIQSFKVLSCSFHLEDKKINFFQFLGLTLKIS